MSRSAVAVPWDAIREISGAAGDVVTFPFRGDYIRGIAGLDYDVIARRRQGGYPRPITELMNLDLVLNTVPERGWPEPARLEVAAVPHQAPMAAIKRAARWASYCTRVAVVPAGTLLTEPAALEAQVRGIWVIDCAGGVLVNGHLGAWPTSSRGILHQLLAETLWNELDHDQPQQLDNGDPGPHEHRKIGELGALDEDQN